MNNTTIIVPMRLYTEEAIIPMRLTSAVQFIENANWYEGPYTFTPGLTAQTIPIADKTAQADITIEAIPNNYGLITYNGTTITVS